MTTHDADQAHGAETEKERDGVERDGGGERETCGERWGEKRDGVVRDGGERETREICKQQCMSVHSVNKRQQSMNISQRNEVAREQYILKLINNSTDS